MAPLRLSRQVRRGYAVGMELPRLPPRFRIDAAGLEVVLRPDRPLRLAGAHGRRLVCTAGCAWITAPGMIDDLFLRRGDAWEVASDGLVLVEAVGSARVALGDQAMSPST